MEIFVGILFAILGALTALFFAGIYFFKEYQRSISSVCFKGKTLSRREQITIQLMSILLSIISVGVLLYILIRTLPFVIPNRGLFD